MNKSGLCRRALPVSLLTSLLVGSCASQQVTKPPTLFQFVDSQPREPLRKGFWYWASEGVVSQRFGSGELASDLFFADEDGADLEIPYVATGYGRRVSASARTSHLGPTVVFDEFGRSCAAGRNSVAALPLESEEQFESVLVCERSVARMFPAQKGSLASAGDFRTTEAHVELDSLLRRTAPVRFVEFDPADRILSFEQMVDSLAPVGGTIELKSAIRAKLESEGWIDHPTVKPILVGASDSADGVQVAFTYEAKFASTLQDIAEWSRELLGKPSFVNQFFKSCKVSVHGNSIVFTSMSRDLNSALKSLDFFPLFIVSDEAQ